MTTNWNRKILHSCNGKFHKLQLFSFHHYLYRSPEAVELSSIIKLLGVIPDVCVEEYIVNFFKDLTV